MTISISVVRKSKKYMSKVHITLIAFKDVQIALGLFTVFVTPLVNVCVFQWWGIFSDYFRLHITVFISH